MSTTTPVTKPALSFNGYHRKQTAPPEMSLCEVGRGTAGGEYQRRFWHPLCFVDELGRNPLRVRALGEDLVAFKTGVGEVGVLHLRCCHRNTSLEYGVVTDCGIQCCYHGRTFGVDGRILSIPGDPAANRLAGEVAQGAYPTHVLAGIVFIYMGPPERIPVFPHLDRFDVPGIKLVPGPRLKLDCNWLQVKENAVDPHHTAVLHVIPQLRGMDHFANEFERFPELIWRETPAGVMYLAARRVEGNVWVRSAEIYGGNIHCISSIFESGRDVKRASLPFMTFWTLPVDDEHSINFFISHVAENEQMPFEQRRELELFGQTDDRPYHERQEIPGDHDAQVGQGPINVHALEHLGTYDRGITLFRRQVRQGIKAVQQGGDPRGFYLRAEDLPPTYANDRVVREAEVGGDVTQASVLTAFAERVAEDYFADAPISVLRRSLGDA